MKLRNLIVYLLGVFMFLGASSVVDAQEGEDEPVVQAVLFYSPTCPHCHHVITEVLIPMQEQYGPTLQILGLSTQDEAGSFLYQAAVEHYEIPENRLGVPLLIVADKLMVGSVEIEEQFPPIVEDGFSGDGVPWPDFPALFEVFPDLPTTVVAGSAEPVATKVAVTVEATETAVSTPTAEPPVAPISESGDTDTAVLVPEIIDETEQVSELPGSPLDAVVDDIVETEAAAPPADPVGMAIGSVVLIGMLVTLGYAIGRFIVSQRNTAVILNEWTIPVIALVGLGVALYLGYVEVTHTAAVCGPVGECNIVQSSPYARLLGVPVAGWGVLNYVTILVLWFGQRRMQGSLHTFVIWSLVLLTVFGTFYSIFLTGLELFVIRAVCLWCLSSAVITTVLMILIVLAFTQKAESELVFEEI